MYVCIIESSGLVIEDLVKRYQPSCDCILGDEKKESEPFYTHLGVAKTLPELPKVW